MKCGFGCRPAGLHPDHNKMTSPFLQSLRSRGFATAAQVGLWVLLYLVVRHLGGSMPDFHETTGAASAPQPLVPIARFDAVTAAAPVSLPGSNVVDPFYTLYFVPPAPTPVPAPTTRKIEVTYQGYYETGAGAREAMLKVGDAFLIARPGGLLATNLYVAAAGMQSVLLTNSAGKTNLLQVNKPQTLEVPLK
jgi:hypothetical protein